MIHIFCVIFFVLTEKKSQSVQSKSFIRNHCILIVNNTHTHSHFFSYFDIFIVIIYVFSMFSWNIRNNNNNTTIERNTMACLTRICTKEGKKLESKVNSHLILIANIIIIVVVRRRLLNSSIPQIYTQIYQWLASSFYFFFCFIFSLHWFVLIWIDWRSMCVCVYCFEKI